jgi:hypothetical protein
MRVVGGPGAYAITAHWRAALRLRRLLEARPLTRSRLIGEPLCGCAGCWRPGRLRDHGSLEGRFAVAWVVLLASCFTGELLGGRPVLNLAARESFVRDQDQRR